MQTIKSWIVALTVLAASAYWWLWRQRPLANVPPAHPPRDFAAALQGAQLRFYTTRREKPLPECEPIIMVHPDKTARAIVLLHGFTNCPAQYRLLAEQLFDRGYNVLVPRFPHHGLPNRTAPELGRMTAEGLIATAAEAVDLARGLGNHVTVLGLSMGGVVAGWLAQNRADVDLAVLVAPAFTFKAFPNTLTPLLARLFGNLPVFYRWWDPILKADAPGPAHTYHGFPSSAFAEMLRLGVIVRRQAARQRPRAGRIDVVVNPCDESIDNRGALALAAQWRAHGGNVREHAFPQEYGLIHDLIDPTQPAQQVNLVYPILIEWIEA